MGRWRIDDHTVQFAAASTRGNVNLPLENIRRVETVQRKFLVVTKPVLLVTYLPRSGTMLHRMWVLTGDLPEWEVRLRAKVSARALPFDEDRIGKAIALTHALLAVKGPTAQILDVLSASGPATSATVSGLLNLDANDAVMLSTTLSTGFAQVDRVMGGPALRYERSRFDTSTGIVHSMSWWLDDEVAIAWISLREPVEVYRDGDSVVAITSMPTKSSHNPPSVDVEDGGCGLLVRGDWGYSRYIELPAAVYDDVSVSVQSNGTLVVTGQCRLDEDQAQPSGY